MTVIDVSAAAALITDDRGNLVRGELLKLAAKTTAPTFFRVESAQVAWKYAQFGQCDQEQASKMYRTLVSMVDTYVDDAELIREAFNYALLFEHSVYDMLYFVLAKRCDAQLFTRDKKLIKLCHENNVDCIDLVDLLSTVEE